jgi:hypothetical protein
VDGAYGFGGLEGAVTVAEIDLVAGDIVGLAVLVEVSGEDGGGGWIG